MEETGEDKVKQLIVEIVGALKADAIEQAAQVFITCAEEYVRLGNEDGALLALELGSLVEEAIKGAGSQIQAWDFSQVS